MGQMTKKAYRTLGFVFFGERPLYTDPAAFRDWQNIGWTRTEMREDLHFGRLPEGLMLRTPEGVRVVMGRQGYYDQVLVTMAEVTLEPSSDGWPMVTLDLARLKELRLRMAMTQRDMARAIGVSEGTIGRVERDPQVNLHPETRSQLELFFRQHQEEMA